MKRFLPFVILLAMLLCGCGADVIIPTEEPGLSQEITQSPTEPSDTQPQPTNPTDPTNSTEPPATEPTEPVPTEPTEPIPTEPEHSALYIPGVDVEDVILYYNEVVLDAEFVNSGDASKVQKWAIPIVYTIHGQPTEADLALMDAYTQWLNGIEGFPGIREAEDPGETNLDIHFCSQSQMINLLGNSFYGCDGGVTFWYGPNDRIYKETICIRNDLDQELRNSVILEEIYNGLGPVQDTDLRTDSIIYSGFSKPQSLTNVDELILKLLYHPDIQCSMTSGECEEVIRRLYY